MTFKGDEDCLCQCLRALKNQQSIGHNLEIHILDDNNNPIEKVYDFIDYKYKQTFFRRNGNLNGAECTHGMLIEMARIARESRAEYIMKVDSDMFIRSLDNFLYPLEEDNKQVIGFQLKSTMNYCAGVTYILPSSGLYNAVKGFHNWFKDAEQNDPDFIDHCPEDWAISRCVAQINNFTMLQYNNWSNHENWLLSPFVFKEIRSDGSLSPLTLSRFQIYDFVNFGNRYELDCDNPREVAANCMKKFADFDL